MKVKKIKILFSFFILMFSAGLLCACGGTSGTVKFKQASLTMSLNQEMDLDKLVDIDGCNFEDVTFVSSDPEIVYIRSNGKLVSRAEGVSVISAKGYDDAILEITVRGTSVKFSTPSNLAYDETKNAVVWDAVYAGESVATTYNVKISKDGGEFVNDKVNTNSYQVLDAGNYKIKVSCAERTDVGILASGESQEYTFSKLSAPYDLEYNDATGILSWKANETVTDFRVLVNGVSTVVLNTSDNLQLAVTKEGTENTIKIKDALNLNEPKKYEISVMACASSEMANVFGATSVNSLSLTRLKAPTVNITNGTITWEDEGQGASWFDLTITGATTIKEKIYKNSAGQYSYTLSGKDPGEYAIEMVAMGDSSDLIYSPEENYLNSEMTTVSGVIKLAKQSLAFDKANKTIRVVDFDASNGYKLSLTVKYNGSLKEVVDISASGQYVSEFEEAGVYEFVLSNLSNTNLQINGDDSDAISVIRLGKASQISHKIEDGKYYVENYQVNDASKYVIEILQKSGGENRFELTEENNLVADLFGEAGEYVVNIYAYGTDLANTYYLDSVTNTKLSVLRLADCTLTDDTANKAITWQDVANIGNLRYSYELSGASQDSGLLEDNKFSYAGLGVGSYTLNVWATTSAVEGEQTIILDSINKKAIDFSIYKTITAPNLDWSKQTLDGGVVYYLQIANVEGAKSYTIYSNGSAIGEVLASQDEYVLFDTTNCFTQKGEGEDGNDYTLEVVANNKDSIYYYDSDKSSVKVSRAEVPTNFSIEVIGAEVEVKETISSSIVANWYSGTEILINDIACTDLADERLAGATVYNVKIKYIANENNVNGVYYLDSDYAEFTISKIQAKLEVNGLKLNWQTTKTTQNVTNRLIISQGENVEIIEVNGETEYDLSRLNTKKFNLENAVSISFQTVIKAFDGTISGEYVDGKFVSGNLVGTQRVLNGYYCTSNLDTITVQYANDEIGLSVKEENGNVNISLTKKADAVYKLNGDTAFTLASSAFEPSVVNTMCIEEIVEQTRNIYLFTITRLENVESISVNEDETISLENLPQMAEKIVCLIEGVEITDLTSVTGSTGSVVLAYYKAGENEAQNYYLNSNATSFTFKRLENLNITSNLNIYNNIISWNREENPAGNTYKYLVTFYDENGTGEEYSVTLDLATTNSIDLAENTYADIIYALAGTKYVKVQKIVGAFNASSSKDNYLTSGSSSVELQILNAPTSVKITANDSDITQTDIQITWNIDVSNGYTPAKYNVKIYNQYTEMAVTTTGYYTLTQSDTFFKQAGEWFVEVQAVGEQNIISSKYSSVAKITRLKATSSLAVTTGGLIEWGRVENASEYILEYSYNKKDGIKVEVSKTFDTETTSYQMPQAELNSLFDGSVSAVLYAVGTGESNADSEGYLTSYKETIFKRITAPEITLTSTYIVFDNYASYVTDELIYVTAEIAGKQVLNLQVRPEEANGKYIWTYPKTYSYYENNALVEVDFTTAKDIVFSVYARSIKANCIDSNTVTKTANILANITDLKFARTADGVIHFYATNPNTTVTTTIVTIAGQDYTINGNVDIAITEEMLASLSTTWTITAKALGGDGDAVYIQGKAITISGKKLTNSTSISTNATNTKVIWTEIVGATDYRLKVYSISDPDSITEKDGYLTTKEEVVGASYGGGIYKFAIKAIGNVADSYLSTNVVLDGTYSAEQQIIKLNQIKNVAVQKGFFSFDTVDLADEYMAVLYTDLASNPIAEYSLSAYTLPTGETGTYYYSQGLMDKIADGEEYYVQFYAKSTTIYNISSQVSQITGSAGTENYLIISAFAPTENAITLSHPNIDDNNLNYAVTYATLNVNAEVNTGILLSIDDNIQFTTNSVHILDADGSWAVGRHFIKYAQLGSSSIGDNRKVYLTAFGEETKITKLGESSVVFGYLEGDNVKENVLAFATVNNADAYYCYIGDEGASDIYGIYDNTSFIIDLTNLKAGEYASVSVRPISKDINYLAGNRVYLKETEDTTNNMSIIKHEAPENFIVEDGSLNWQPSVDTLLTLAKDDTKIINSPFFTTLQMLPQQKIKLKFTNKTTGQVSEFVDNAYKYMYITDDIIALLETLNMTDVATSLKEAQVKGFPYINYGFLDFANVLPGGLYDIQVKLLGTFILTEIDTNEMCVLFSSNYTEAITKYIANAPEIRVENNSNVYNLKFTNVTVNTSYFTSTDSGLPTYNIVGVYTDENGKEVREILTTVKATGINNSEEIVVNLTSLVESGVLTAKHKTIYVYVNGNDAMGVLNGKCSNQISVIILEEISATVEHGIIKWSAQENATKYIVTYGSNTLEMKYVEGKAVYTWECEDLVENQEYTLSIMAYGSQGKNASSGGIVVISGKNTNLGTIKKLEGISNVKNGIDVKKGIYNWTAIANATGYDVFIVKAEVTDGSYGTYSTIKTNQFETTADNLENYYYFRAVGTENETLTKNTFVYVNSNISAYNKGLRCTGVSNLQFENGILSWTYTNTNTSFKIVFNRKNGGSAEEDIVIYTTYTECVKNGICYIDTNAYEALRNYGDYTVSVQAFFEDKIETNTNTGVYFLISSAKTLDFHKLETVSEIKVQEGVISWEYTGKTNLNYHFRLQFSYYDTTTGKTVEETKYVAGGTNKYEGIIFEDDISKYPITLVIYVVPGKIAETTNIAYALSVPYTYENDLYQFDRVSEDTISISITDNGQLLIDWYGPDDDNGEAVSYRYEVCYYTDRDTAERFISTASSHILCGDGQDISFDIDEEYSLYIKIRIIPIADNYISSAWTEPRQIEKPTKVTGLTYNEEKFEYTWDTYETGDELQSSFYYKVKDEIGHFEEINGTQTFVVDTVYIFNVNIGDEVFTPFVIGTHRVSVAVIIKNSASTGLMSDYCDPVISQINMFDGGDGTEENPYIIATSEQFGNIKYRLTKDTKNNSYYDSNFVNGELVVDEELTTMSSSNTIYHFKQVANLQITSENAIVNYPDADGNISTDDLEFNGSYNGDYYSLTLVWNTNIESNSAVSHITLFEKVGTRGVLANINVLLNIDTTININKYMIVSALVYDNSGTIQNIVVGKADTLTDIVFANLRNNFTLSFIAYNNNGTIQTVENYYNVNLTTGNNIAAVAYASVAINSASQSTIISAKNYGYISVNAAIANVGGIVQYMANNSVLEQSANIGNIHVFLKGTSLSLIGGLVGKAVKAQLTYSYSVCDITVASASSVSPNAYVGGLIGQSEGDNITYSYTNVTKNGNLISGYSAYSGIYQLVGYLTSVSGNSKNVYYKTQADFNAVSTTGNIADSFIEYTDNATTALGLFETDSKFTDDVLYKNNPTLKWEAAFEKLEWKTLAE